MKLIEISSLDHPGIEVFASLTDGQLRNRLDPGNGIFIAESPKVIRIALASGYTPVSLLCERKHIEGDAADIIATNPDMPVYTGSRELLTELTGYKLTRGVLCAMRRKPLPTVKDICSGAKRIAVMDGVSDSTNIGAIFRSAAALGVDGIVLSTTSCDPLNRRAVRVSMGTVFMIPWTTVEPANLYGSLRKEGFKIVALALTDRSVGIDDPVMLAEPRLAMVLGTEGDGLAREAIEDADYVARIPMSRGVDSLNVAAASAVAFYVLNFKPESNLY
ncbi:MAG: RNA methyltransferase [Muribaculaceae bacterium]|nr:RNA methyltransferase [Muribaculaceae bacterium]